MPDFAAHPCLAPIAAVVIVALALILRGLLVQVFRLMALVVLGALAFAAFAALVVALVGTPAGYVVIGAAAALAGAAMRGKGGGMTQTISGNENCTIKANQVWDNSRGSQ